jgi:hypothetical protein
MILTVPLATAPPAIPGVGVSQERKFAYVARVWLYVSQPVIMQKCVSVSAAAIGSRRRVVMRTIRLHVQLGKLLLGGSFHPTLTWW